MALCHREGACVDMQAISEGKVLLNGNGTGLSEGTADVVSLNVLSWNVAGPSEDSTVICLSQISMLTAWDILLPQECFKKERWCECCRTRALHAERTGGGTAVPSSHHTSAAGRASRWIAVGWTVDYHLGPSHRGRKLRDFETVLAEIPDFIRGRLGHHLILGGDFIASFYGLTDFHDVGESIPSPRTLTDTNDARHVVVAELDLTVTNTWMDAGSGKGLYTRCSWTEPGDAQTQLDFIIVSEKLEARRLQVLDFDWLKTDLLAVLAVLSLKSRLRHSAKPAVSLRGWKPQRAATETLICDGALALGNCIGPQMDGDQGDD